MFFRSAILLAALPLLAIAEKRPVSIDDVIAIHAARPGSGPITWAPDGRRFAFREHDSIWQYDARSKLKKEIVSLIPLREKAVKGPPAGAFDWRNRRVSEASYQWSQSGEQMLVEAGGDLFLVQVSTGDWTQLTQT